MTYLDANIFIYATINNGETGEKCRKILVDIIERNDTIYTSVLTWDEIVYGIWKKEGKEKAIIGGENFMKLPNIILLNSTNQIIMKSQEIMNSYGLKPRDAIHVATAILNNIREIISDDSDFDKVKELKRIPPEKFK